MWLTNRATVRPHHSHTIVTLTLSSYFGSPRGSWLHINVVINWQLSKQGIRWPVSPDCIAGSGVDPSRSSIFWCYPLTIYSFSIDCRLTFTFFKIHIKCQYRPAILRFWLQTQKFNQFFRNTGGKDLFLPWSHVGHAPRPVLMLWLVKIWRVSSRVKFMQHLQSCLLWRLRLTEFWVNLWCF